MIEPAREAGWLTKAEMEIAVARREGYILSPQFFRGAKLQTTVALVMAGVLTASVVGVVAAHGYGIDGLLLAIAGLSLGLIPLARHWERRQEAAREGDREMRESFGHGGRFVSMIVRQGEAPTGEDRGMLWFEDDRLYFSGHRTSFGLVPQQVRGPVLLKGRVPGVRNRLNLVLDLEGRVRTTSVSFSLLLPAQANSDYVVGKFKAQIDGWLMEHVSGSGQWPPMGLGPGVVTERRLLLRALARTTLPPILPALFLVLGSAPQFAGVAYVLVAIIAGTAPGTAVLWRALRDRRRLERAQWKP